jgi:hypothetical protein
MRVLGALVLCTVPITLLAHDSGMNEACGFGNTYLFRLCPSGSILMRSQRFMRLTDLTMWGIVKPMMLNRLALEI